MNQVRRAAWRATLAIGALALVVRCAFALWAAPRFPAAGDGVYYETFARRLASGAGYTWAWPDGVVTYAAHYPVGYPAIIAVFYKLFGPSVRAAMQVNAALGAVGVVAGHRVSLRLLSEPRALLAGVVLALHPALVLYTPAVMTEGATLSLLLLAAAIALGEGALLARSLGAGVVMGLAILVRPQCLALSAILAGCTLFGRSFTRAAMVRAALLFFVSVLVCLPWTARNCQRMHRCALVSVNGGWNLAIGAQTHDGAWEPIEVPEPCRTVWDEAAKDTCFEREAKRVIAHDPSAWVAKVPAKLSATLDYFGAGPWYLHASNGAAFTERDKLRWGVVETVVSRALLLASLIPIVLSRIRWTTRVVAALGCAFALSVAGWIAYGLLGVLLVVTRDRSRFSIFAALSILATMATHAAFFGAGRYGLVLAPLVAILALRAPDMGAKVPSSTTDRRSPA